jgi:hypothetical protein
MTREDERRPPNQEERSELADRDPRRAADLRREDEEDGDEEEA